MNIETIIWDNNRVRLIDQRFLPSRVVYSTCVTVKDMYEAIKKMKVRGAPAIGIAGAYGVYLGIRNSRAKTFPAFRKELEKVIEYLSDSRPTAKNLFWAGEKMAEAAENSKNLPVEKLKEVLLDEAHSILEEDTKICRAIGRYGARLLPRGANVLTHCNAGALATGGYGTALGVLYSARKKIKMVYADETRPVLQGARLTAWELVKAGIPVTVICDNMAASLMAGGDIGAVIVGADRIAANGDTANKIGTYSLAIVSAYHKVPFYVAAPFSTFDLSMPSGKMIPIEDRSSLEVKKINGKYITPEKAAAKNPSFDVTPAGLITAIITERGVIDKPSKKNIENILNRKR
ncbi:MAG: S-methyl-5-thioribose-1-phosphate isomerase [Candidatus Omnitrophota bacterium]